MAGTVCRSPGKSAEWKTISHWTRRSREKNDEAFAGICKRMLGLRGRPLEDRYGDGHSMSNKSRESRGDMSRQPCSWTSWLRMVLSQRRALA